jgi:hypothetical protein
VLGQHLPGLTMRMGNLFIDQNEAAFIAAGIDVAKSEQKLAAGMNLIL